MAIVYSSLIKTSTQGKAYSKNIIHREPFDIEDPTYTSVSVMKGNGILLLLLFIEEPTMGDNIISFAYIMLNIYNCLFVPSM